MTSVGTVINIIPKNDFTNRFKYRNNYSQVNIEIRKYQHQIFNSIYRKKIFFKDLLSIKEIELSSYTIIAELSDDRNYGSILLKTKNSIIIHAIYK